MKKYILILLTFILGNIALAQKPPSVDIVGGLGFAELLHIGIKTQISKRGQIGLYYGNGLYHLEDEYYRTLFTDYQYHFGKNSKHINRKVYYARAELIYWTINNDYQNMKSWAYSIGIGREFHISKKIGICTDISFIRAINQNRLIKDERLEPWLDITLSDAGLLPTFRMQLFYSL